MTNGHLIQINGIPSSGKSSLATALIHLMPGFEILTGTTSSEESRINRESLRPDNSLDSPCA